MANAHLRLNGAKFSVGKRLLVLTCALFESRPGLLESRYQVRSRVSTPSFELSLAALENKPVTVTDS
jgi:hypothetical protein